MEFCKEKYGKSHGSHATPSEVAVTYFAYPDAQKDAPLEPQIAPNGRFTDAADYRARFPDGRIGSDPSLATVEDGGRLVELSATGMIEDFRAFCAA